YLQCHFGRKKGNQGVNTVLAGWYTLAEVADGTDPTHLCKLEVSCGTPVALYDIRSDPNERANLMKYPPSFCSARVNQLVTILRDAITARRWHHPCFELKLPCAPSCPAGNRPMFVMEPRLMTDVVLAPVLALFSPSFYRRIGEASFGRALLYLGYLSLLFSLAIAGLLVLRWMPALDAL